MTFPLCQEKMFLLDILIKARLVQNEPQTILQQYLREVQATFLNQRIDYTVHDGHQSQNQDRVERLLQHE